MGVQWSFDVNKLQWIVFVPGILCLALVSRRVLDVLSIYTGYARHFRVHCRPAATSKHV
jgi:hypothetical protein